MPASVACRLAGISLKPQHYREVLERKPAVGWFEVHAENYMARGGPDHAYLDAIRRDYQLSVHGVGLSLGSAGGIDPGHLARLKSVVERFQPALVSEHLAWSRLGDVYLGDLLPIPYSDDALRLVAANVARVQEVLGRRILVENPSRYGAFAQADEVSEPEFLNALAAETGCGILLDLNNIYVSAHNLGLDAEASLRTIDPAAVGEIHLAGHARRRLDGTEVLIDDHGSQVADEVWALYENAVSFFGSVPTIVEWDSNVPSLDTLAREAARAALVLSRTVAPEVSYALTG